MHSIKVQVSSKLSSGSNGLELRSKFKELVFDDFNRLVEIKDAGYTTDRVNKADLQKVMGLKAMSFSL